MGQGYAGAPPYVAAIRTNRDDLAQTLTRLYAVVVAASCTAWCLIVVKVPTLPVLGAVAVLLAGAAVAFRLGRAAAPVAASALVAGSLAGLLMLSLVPGREGALWFMALPLLVAAATLGPAASLAAAAAAVAAIAAWHGAAHPWPTQALLLGLTGGFGALASYVVGSALEWAWRRSQDADHLAQQLQERQGKLNRTLRALELTNHLLQRSNRELEMARREAEEARRLKAEFAASISHELRTPLNVILGFTEIMSRSPEVYGDVPWTPTLRRDVSEIRRNALYLSEFVDDVLDLARIDALRMPIRREQTALAEVVEEAVGVTRRLVTAKPVRLTVAVPEGLPALFVDRTRVRQVLLNLLTNACRHTDEGSITVAARLEGEEVVVDVSDTGSGIAPGDLERIFDEFEQVNAWRPGERGKGLGLAVAKHLVSLHGGRIWAGSTPGRGSTFSFSLPVAPKQVGRIGPSVETPLPAGAAAPSLLVLDEEDLATTYLRRQLDGYSVSRVGDAEELRRVLSQGHPDAVLVNLAPGAEPSLRELRRLTAAPGVPVLGCALPGWRWPGQDERFAACLTKPVSSERLLQAVRELAPQGPVLVVDDDRGFVQFVRRGFEAAGEGERVIAAYDGAEALELARQWRPALMLVDLVMPEMDGFALADAVRADESLRETRIVAVSGAGPGEEALSARGDAVVVCKPLGFKGGELMQVLRAVLGAVRADYVTRPGSVAEPSEAETAIPAS